MCGILGYISKSTLEKTYQFERALKLMQHRGPDNSGKLQSECYILGHNRLSIIDLSVSGNQPMVDNNTGLIIVYNGEIYNYIELRDELSNYGHIFKTESDTEVLLKAYIQWGVHCIERLNGMWAFAIWHPNKKKIFIARDRFGIKPLYYRSSKGEFAFASEPKALLSMFAENRIVNEGALYEFLTMGNLYSGEDSFYKGINVLQPSHCAVFDLTNNCFKKWRYWKFPHKYEESKCAEEEAEYFYQLFEDAVRVRLRSDVPVGITLSGGLDSTAVLAAAVNTGARSITCFTSVYGNNEIGESLWAAKATSKYGIQPIEVEAPYENWYDTMEKIAWHMDGPGYSPAVYPLWHLMKASRKMGITVLLEGQGADEALGGYPQYSILQLMSNAHRLIKQPSIEKFINIKKFWKQLVNTFTLRWSVLWLLRECMPWLVDYYRKSAGAASTLRPEFYNKWNHLLRSRGESPTPEGTDIVTKRLMMDHSVNILPGLLHYGDAISMAHGVESRLPFMDFRIVEFLFSRPDDIKIRHGKTKWLLRKYLYEQGQYIIGDRKDKQGYPTPAERWLSKDAGKMAKNVLLSKNACIHEYCSPKLIKKLIDRHISGHPTAGHHVYRLFSTEIWLNSLTHSM